MASRIRKILITAGPTREMLDPVRYLSNQSTGEMGYALAKAAQKRKYSVTLVSGPVAIQPPKGIRRVDVVSAEDLRRTLNRLFVRHDVLIMSAAVCDFTPVKFSPQKLKRQSSLFLKLKKTQDIIASLAARKGPRQVVIGFCLETSRWLERAKEKLKRKRLDGIVANFFDGKHNPFGRRRVTMALVSCGGTPKIIRMKSKDRIADEILKWIEAMNASGQKNAAELPLK